VQKLEQHPEKLCAVCRCRSCCKVECRSLSSILKQNVCCVQMQELLQGGVQKLEQHPDHQEDVPTRPELTGLLANAHKLLQLKEAGNKWVS